MSYFLKSDVFEYICCSGVGQIESVWKKVRGGVMVMHNFTKVKSGGGGGL